MVIPTHVENKIWFANLLCFLSENKILFLFDRFLFVLNEGYGEKTQCTYLKKLMGALELTENSKQKKPSYEPHKKAFLYTRKDSNPQPSEPKSDILSS
tara:strand:+ start:9596 stop:9889 length:294 start_codon:yes stop_codon:yes gene_type:complete